MKKICLLILFTIIFYNTSVNAKSFNLERATGECNVSKKNLFSDMDYNVYKNTFIVYILYLEKYSFFYI